MSDDELPEDPDGKHPNLNALAVHRHELYLAHRRAGFGHASAIYLVTTFGSDSSYPPPTTDDSGYEEE